LHDLADLLVRLAQIRVVVAQSIFVKSGRPVGDHGQEEQERKVTSHARAPTAVRRAL
jgi:hypothetical protein